MTRVVTFDGDQTLWDFRAAMRQALQDTLERLRAAVPSAATLDIDDLIAARDVEARQAAPGATHEEIRRRAFAHVLAGLGRADDTALGDELYQRYMRLRFERIEAYADTRRTLERLAVDHRLGLVTNGNTYPGCCGLAEYFDACVYADEVGSRKPEPRIFEAAARKLGCAAAELIHVGDQLDTDVAGARAVGAFAVWLNRDGEAPAGPVVPDLEIRSLDELPTRLAEGQRR